MLLTGKGEQETAAAIAHGSTFFNGPGRTVLNTRI
jgi:hypothetical protein